MRQSGKGNVPGAARRGAQSLARRPTVTRPAAQPRRAAVRPGTARTTRRNVARPGAYQGAARNQLRRYRQGSMLAVAITAWLLLALGAPGEAQQAEDTAGAGVETVAPQQEPPGGAALPDTAGDEIARSVGEATSTIRELTVGFMGVLPKLLVAIGLLLAAALVSAVVRPLLRRVLRSWTRADAVAALAGIIIWLLAISAALSVVVGDPRTLLGSVGLIGLALSWALQSPIESFTAWLLNSFRGYYRVGDRIGVGEVFGDVYRIDFLTTTVWEAGGPDKSVQGAQPTGGLVTFPNSEVLRSNVINYTWDFPFVWDEVSIALASESDLDYSAEVLGGVARESVGQAMAAPVAMYRRLLADARLDIDIADEPQVFFSQGDSWTNATIRYLVDARRRRVTASDLLRAVSREMPRDEHKGRMIPAYPLTRVALVDPEVFPGA